MGNALLTLRLRYFIKEGRVSESGTHDQLLEQRGDYYEYVQLQMLSKK
jgi:ATP-binding cassette subfamily B (MDR/TAP) protein 1